MSDAYDQVRRAGWTGCLVVMMLVGGCHSSTDEVTTGGDSEGVAGEQTTRVLKKSVEAPFAEDETETMQPAERIREIDWEAADTTPLISPDNISERIRRFYEGAPVPVLLPDDRRALQTVEPTVGEHWYAAVFSYRGREVTIEGDRIVRQTESLPSPAGDGDSRFRLSQTHGILTISFTRFGAAYTLDVECEEVSRRGTCTNESFATELADNLARVGGIQ